MSELIASVVHFIAQNAVWTFPIMFVTAFAESFAFVSLIFPGLAIIIAAGLLVPSGAVPLLPLLAGTILGSIAGDAVSWWLGRNYGHVLAARWPFSGNPRLLARGEALFRRFGSVSVFIGRFLGPFRAIIPVVAGMMHLPARQFWTANIASALVWAPAIILPGSAVALLWKKFDPEMLWLYVTGGVVIAVLLIAAAVFVVRQTRTLVIASDAK
ncbi:MAG: DedA family protein [Alphaproteobacteria bacterium]|jgi:membrane protein DedA with SNARE-associated domain|nr:DedA family protein [Alphaproteobacteria bacterium]MBN9566225.1 DedA family protein [Alphaproteobacteria bacterium]MBN9590755.1 DedA family protein [Alphaproteobacteria bacterium]